MEVKTLSARFDCAQNQWHATEPVRAAGAGLPRSGLHEIAVRHVNEATRLEKDLTYVLFGEPDKFPPRARDRYVFAIGSIVQHLQNLGISARIGYELLALATALSDLDDGVVHPMLLKRKPNGAPRLRGEVWQTKAYIAGAVSLLMSDGLLKDAACKRIAKEFPQLGTPPLCKKKCSGAALAESIGDWHKKFAGGEVPEPDAQTIFDDRAKLFDHHSSFNRTDDKAAIARSILRFAVETAVRCQI